MNTPNHYIVEMLEDYNTPSNDRKYSKYERLFVWERGQSYDLANNNADSIPKRFCKVIYDVEFNVAKRESEVSE